MMKQTETAKPHLQVVSSDEQVSELILLEALDAGWTVTADAAPPREMAADAVIWDVRTVGTRVSAGGAPLAVIVSSEGQRSDAASCVWQWPMRLTELRHFLRRCEVERGQSMRLMRGEAMRSTGQSNGAEATWTLPPLTPNERSLLACLAESGGQPIAREQLCERMGMSDRTLNVHLCHLRQKLEEPFGVRIMETVRGQGICLHPDLVARVLEKERNDE